MAIVAATPFRCQIRPEGKCATVALSGELDLATAPQVASTVENLVNAGFFKVTVDLSELTFIDSSGMSMLLAASRLAADHCCAFTLVRGPNAVHRPFVLTGLEYEFEFETPPAGMLRRPRWFSSEAARI